MSIPLRLLILEDNPSDAELMASELRRAGFEPEWKRVETRVAFQAALAPDLQLILADYGLPQFDGLSALDLLRQSGFDVPFILVSGSVGEELAVEAVHRGAADYLLKDRLKRLGASVTSALQNKHLRDQRRQAELALVASERRFRAMTENAPDAITLIRADGTVIYDSPAAPRLLGYETDELIGRNVFVLVHPDDLADVRSLFEQALRQPGTPVRGIFRFQRKDGSWAWIEASASNLLAQADVQAVVINYRDVTERKQAETALREGEERYRVLVSEMSDGIFITDERGTLTFVNPALVRIHGFEQPAELLGRKFADFVAPSTLNDVAAYFRLITEGEKPQAPVVVELARPDGTQAIVEVMATVKQAGGMLVGTQGVVRDITARRQAEKALHENEERFHGLFDNAAVGMYRTTPDGRILAANPAAVRMLGFASVEELAKRNLEKDGFDADHPRREFRARLKNEGSVIGLESAWKRKDGATIFVRESATGVRDAQGNVLYYDGTFEDITERKQAEAERQALLEIMQGTASTEGLQEFLELVRQSLSKVLPAENLFVVFYVQSTGQFEEIFAVDKYDAPMPPSKLEKSITSYVFRTGEPLLMSQAKFEELRLLGEVELVGSESASWLGAPLKTPTATIGVIAIQDYERPDCYTERHKQFMASVGAQVAVAMERKRAEDELARERSLLRALTDNVPDTIYFKDLDGRFLLVNEAQARRLGLSNPAQAVGKTDFDFFPEQHARLAQEDEKAILRGGRPLVAADEKLTWPDGQVGWVSTTKMPLPDQTGNVIGTFGISRDITRRKQAEEQIRGQLDRMSALRVIDQTIASTFDLRLSLETVLSHGVSLLGVDAACIALVDAPLGRLEYAARLAFGMAAAGLYGSGLGGSYAGRVVLDRRALDVPSPAEGMNPAMLPTFGQAENFVSYKGRPLIEKGKVLGVLELFDRKLVERDQEWLDFLGALAGRAAIAINDAQLFEGLQRSNLELVVAYDATIEGWSRAMDLRDHETEGHTLRVTQTTLELARAMGSSDETLAQIRRGALLHDIGKMGVPDAILLKPGPLTAEEWVLMKQHPKMAYEMLAAVTYLRAALDIPYCHHEKWDGTGYPRGLKGEQIPLTARIFAVVDVWDALTSDRPYRKAWSKQQALEHIRAQSGKHFDPQVVDLFLSAKPG